MRGTDPGEGIRGAAFEKGTVVKERDTQEPERGRRGLVWKLFWFGLLLLGLVVLAIRQST